MVTRNLNSFVEKGLYGGALQASIPGDFLDVSDFRPVPDYQEVFADPETDRSVIFELMALENEVQDTDIPRHYFEILREAQGVSSEHASVVEVSQVDRTSSGALCSLSEGSSQYVLVGDQRVSKFREEACNVVRSYLCVFRIPSHTTDIVITVNDPIAVNPQSSVAGTVDPEKRENLAASDLFRQIWDSFKVLDWSLFLPD